ncbi:MAG TPA: Dabb family protein [Pontiella sp.]|nr:Dabb family protein [Pontiella sp.]
MIKHIVMWKFREDAAEADKLEMKRQLEALKGVVPSLLQIEVGMDIVGTDASKDMVLTTLFNSLSDLQAYADDPAHLKVVEFVKPLVSERAVVDYKI